MLRAFLVDDEPLARDELKYLLQRTKAVKVIGEAESVEDALLQIPFLEVDVVFLDIQLSHTTSFPIAEKLLHLKNSPFIVFATAYENYALDAFNVNAVDYILKPFDEVRINQSVQKLLFMIAKKEEVSSPHSLSQHKLAISSNERIIIIERKHIIFAGVVDGQTIIKTLDATYPVQDTLATLEKKLPHFIRVHRGFIINPSYVKEIEPWFNSTYNLHMEDHSTVPVSRTYVKHIKQLFHL